MNDLDGLIRDLGAAPAKALPNIRKAVEVSSRLMKDEWRSEAESANSNRARGYPYSITYDIFNTIGGVRGEIGPHLGGQGSLGILEESPGGVRSTPQRNWRKPFKKVAKDFEDGLAKALEDSL